MSLKRIEYYASIFSAEVAFATILSEIKDPHDYIKDNHTFKCTYPNLYQMILFHSRGIKFHECIGIDENKYNACKIFTSNSFMIE